MPHTIHVHAYVLSQTMSCTSSRGDYAPSWAQGGPKVTPGTCGAIGEKVQVILVWVRAPGVKNAPTHGDEESQG